MKTVEFTRNLPVVAALQLATAYRRRTATAAASTEKQKADLCAFIKTLEGADEGSASSQFADLLKIQASNGNWNVDGYMHGMLNGMVLMAWVAAAADGIVPANGECPFLSAPDGGYTS